MLVSHCCRFGFHFPLLACVLFAAGHAQAAPTAEQALRLTPLQADVDYDKPEAADASQCTIASFSQDEATGWIVKAPTGQVLRRFLDTNADNKVDQWCYYREGIEVYRDIDQDFNGKADQYRWLGTAGTRWGLDSDEDGTIDQWKVISAEEVSSELVAALRDRDVRRFKPLVITSAELAQLGLADEQARDIGTKIGDAIAKFPELAGKQRLVTSKSQWVHFGGGQPGVVAAGTDGASKDVYVYDNVSAIVETDGKHSQVGVGTMVRVDQGWRLIDLPANLLDSQAVAAGYFFQASLARKPDVQEDSAPGLSPEVQRLLGDLEQIDVGLARSSSTPAQLAKLNASRADVLSKLAELAANEQDRTTWIRQLADTVSAAVQAGNYPDGVEMLNRLVDQTAESNDSALVAYVRFRYLTANYTQSVQQPNADYAKIQEKWLEDLAAFVQAYPQSSDAAEAMLQLAIAQEFAGKEEEAVDWYGKIVRGFSSSDLAAKAAGAKRRIESVGQRIDMRGTTVDGKAFDLAKLRGRVVLIHYWATWCEPCKQDLSLLRQAQAKYGNRGFNLVGISLDSSKDDLAMFLRQNRLPWPQLFEEGGLDSRLANELGVLTLPTMLLLDQQGKVINRNISAGELETELEKMVR